MSYFTHKAVDTTAYHQCIKNAVPLGVRKSSIPSADKGLFAAEAIEAGQEVFCVVEPMVTAIHDHSILTACDNCFLNIASVLDIQDGRFVFKDGKRIKTDKKLLTCGKCRVARYCSAECQRAAWKAHHKFECSGDLAKNIGEVTHIAQRALIRFLLRFHGGHITREHMGTVVGPKTLSIEAAILNCARKVLAEALMAKRLAKSDMPIEDVLRLYLRLMMTLKAVINPRYHAAEGRIGVVLDLYSSFINHSCDPNMIMVCEGTSLRYRSIRRIGEMEELTIGYVPLAADVLARRDMLMREYVFMCNCSRCIEEEKTPPNHGVRDNLGFVEMLLSQSEDIADIKDAQRKLSVVLHIAPFTEERPSWPHHVEPLPSIRASIANLLVANRYHEEAIRIHLEDCFVVRRKMFHGQIGPEWVHRLCQVVTDLSGLAYDAVARNDESKDRVPGKWQLYMFYLAHLHLEVGKCYGTDSKTWLGVQSWIASELTGEVARRTGFDGHLPEALAEQEALFEWASIPHATGFEMLEDSRIKPEMYGVKGHGLESIQDQVDALIKTAVEATIAEKGLED